MFAKYRCPHCEREWVEKLPAFWEKPPTCCAVLARLVTPVELQELLG
jgi:hypothetical protein